MDRVEASRDKDEVRVKRLHEGYGAVEKGGADGFPWIRGMAIPPPGGRGPYSARNRTEAQARRWRARVSKLAVSTDAWT